MTVNYKIEVHMFGVTSEISDEAFDKIAEIAHGLNEDTCVIGKKLVIEDE